MRPAPSALAWTTSAMLLVAGAAHVPLVPEHLEEAPYVGVLFVLLVLACVVLAVLLLVRATDARGSDTLWRLSAALCVAAVLAFLVSRTTGLPQLGDDVGHWTEPLAFPALLSEVLVVALAAAHLTRDTPRASSARGSLHRKVAP